MNISKIIGLALIGGGIWWFGRKASAANRTTFSFRSVGADLKKMVINLGLSAANPTGGSISIDALSGNLIMNGATLASVQQFVPQTIQANGVSNLNVQLRPSLLGAWQVFKKLVAGGKQNLAGKLRFVGTARVQGLNIPIDSALA